MVLWFSFCLQCVDQLAISCLLCLCLHNAQPYMVFECHGGPICLAKKHSFHNVGQYSWKLNSHHLFLEHAVAERRNDLSQKIEVHSTSINISQIFSFFEVFKSTNIYSKHLFCSVSNMMCENGGPSQNQKQSTACGIRSMHGTARLFLTLTAILDALESVGKPT